MYTQFVIKHYAFLSDGVWDTATTLTDFYDVNVSLALGDKKDIFSFKINNNRNQYITEAKTPAANLIDAMDKVDIHYCINGATAESSNLVMSGIIKKVTEDINGRGKILRIEGVNLSELATTALVFYDGGSSPITPLAFLQGCLASVANRNQNFEVTWDANNPVYQYSTPSDLDGDPTFPYTTRSDFREFDKSLSYVIDKYLQNDYTGDGLYYWYITNDNKLSIRRRVRAAGTSFTQGTDFKTAKISINADDVKNFVVVKCGNDPANKPITTRYDDVVSRSKYGFRYHLLVDAKIAGDLIDKENFPNDSKFPSSYPYTTLWGVEVTSSSDYISKFRAEAKRRGEARGKEITDISNVGRIQLQATMMPTLNYALGNALLVTAPSYGLTSFEMRVKEIDYDIDGVLITLQEEIAS